MARSRSLLTIGNTITAALRLYLQQPRRYLGQSLVAHLWLLVPIYGWLKFAALSGRIARLFWLQIGDRTEPKAECDRIINSNFIQFWLIHLTVYLLFIVTTAIVYIGISVVLGLILAVIWVIANVQILESVLDSGLDSELLSVGDTLTVILGFGVIVAVALCDTLIYARLFLGELPLAVTPQAPLGQALRQSWRLTSRYTFKIAAIIWMAWFLAVPLSLVLGFVLTFAIAFGLALVTEQEAPGAFVVLMILLTTAVQSLVTLPFWQAVKAVTYYDLRDRTEGIGLTLQER